MSDERLILGFERPEMESKLGESWTALADAEGGFDFVAWFEDGMGDRAWTWRCRKGDSTEGESALSAAIGPASPVTTFKPTPYLSRHYPAIAVEGKEWKGGEAWPIMTTWQWLARAGGGLGDWSGWDLLRADVKLLDASGTVWLAVEDDVIEPPVVASFSAPKGKWVTVEMDLARAARERGLDLSGITNFWMLGKAAKTTAVLVDNIRLAKKGKKKLSGRRAAAGGKEPAALRVLRDSKSFKLPPRRLPAKPKMPAIPRSVKPVSGSVADEPARDVFDGSVVPFGFVGAFDDERIILGRTVHVSDHDLDKRPEVSKERKLAPAVVESRDGGCTWKALPDPVWRNLDHGSSRGNVIDPSGTAVTLSSGPGCVGVGRASPRQHLTVYESTGRGWTRRLPAAIVDSDVRHCCSNFSCVRLLRGRNRGRLWGAWGAVDRRRMLAVHAAFSDDDGRTWWPWGETGLVPGSREGRWALNTYGYQQPRIAQLGDGIACVWQDSRGLVYSALDGRGWSKVRVIDLTVAAPLAVSGNESFRVPGSVVSLGEDLFVTAWNVRGVLRYSGGRWYRELHDVPDAGALSAAGEKLVLVTSGHVEKPPPEKRIQIKRTCEIRAWVRSEKGEWGPPVPLSSGEITLHEYRQMAAVVVPAYGPAGFVPVAWSDGERVFFRRLAL